MPCFPDRVRELRKAKGMTQRQMANALGITERSYQRYEAENNPNHETLLRLADYFDVSLDYLTGRGDLETINLTAQTRDMLSDNRLTLEAKGLYMQLIFYSTDGMAALPDEEKFLEEKQISKKAFDSIINELENLGYIKSNANPLGKNTSSVYQLA